MGLYIQTVLGAAQFTGLVGAGLFVWPVRRLALSSRVVIRSVGLHIDAGASPLVTFATFRLVDPVTGASLLLASAAGTTMEGPAPLVDGADLASCGRSVPRNADGEHWELHIVTTGKTQNGTAVVDFSILPFPETDARDSEAPP